MRPTRFCSLLALLGTAFALPGQALPLSSAFTYQGELYENGQPLIGSVDLRFTPYADSSNPTVLGPPVVVEDVVVSDGVFTAKVDFGPGFFVGDQVWLEVAVRPFNLSDPNQFQLLLPRQELTAAPYTLKPAPGSVTDVELAADAVGASQLNDDAVASAEIVDGSIGTADLAPEVLNGAFWRTGGNTSTGGAVLGTLDAGQSLSLVAPAGITVNGARFNSNTEITVRGNPNAVETNADITLWPRGGEAFFNIATIPNPSTATSTELNSFLVISSVDTAPTFSGYVQRAIMGWDGAFGLGTAFMTQPQARLHVTRNTVGFDTANDSVESQELVLEDIDAQMGLYSSEGGEAGSVLTLGEMTSNNLVNSWGIYRATSGAGSGLRFNFGTDPRTAANPVLFHFGTNASLALGAPPANSETELQITPSAANVDPGVDIVMQPRGANTLFDFKVTGTDETNTEAALLFVGPTSFYEPRLRVTGTGSFGAGSAFDLAHGGSFVFADDSSATSVATTAPNQFLVRATGGVGVTGATTVTGPTTLNGATTVNGTTTLNGVAATRGPAISTAHELTINSDAEGSSADLGLRELNGVTSYVLGVEGADGTTAKFRLTRRSPATIGPPIPVITTRMLIDTNGFVGLNAGSGDPAFPLLVGTSGSNGNGAHLTTGGTWTNTSSRALKEAFTAIDAVDVLDRVLNLPITRWRYRGGEDAWHLGPVAEDFFAAFGLGQGEKHIGTVDADGVALAAIQGLAARSQARADALELENATLREALDALAKRVEALERGD